jgi:competence ComEA-like helix-hairpin-helix protein
VRRPPAAIVLSTASEDELCRLVGVGPAIARRIVAWRTENGGFDSVEQLAQIKGIGRSTIEALRPYVVARAPQQEPPPPPRGRPASRPRTPTGATEQARGPRDERAARPFGRGRTRLDAPEARASPDSAPPAEPPASTESAAPAEPPVVGEPVADVPLSPSRVRGESRRALERRRLPAVMDVPGPGVEPARGLVAFLRDNSTNLALVVLAVAAQLLVVALVVWVL